MADEHKLLILTSQNDPQLRHIALSRFYIGLPKTLVYQPITRSDFSKNSFLKHCYFPKNLRHAYGQVLALVYHTKQVFHGSEVWLKFDV